jgi:hypothetical protein
MLLIHNNAYNSGLTDCQFIANASDRSFTIVVATGHVVIVHRCLFSEPPAELRTDNLITDRDLLDYSSKSALVSRLEMTADIPR